MASPPPPARPAATLILVGDGVDGSEVLVVERAAQGFFGGLTAFPGGAVESVDDSSLAREVVAASGEVWGRPDTVLAEAEVGGRRLFSPTLAHLRWLAGFAATDEALRAAAASRPPPQRRADGSLVPLPLPGGSG